MKIIKTIIIFVLLALAPGALLLLPGVGAMLHKPNYLLSLIDIALAYLSLLISALIAILIYRLQKNDTDKEHKQRINAAKIIMYNELEKAILLYVLRPDTFSGSSLAHIKDTFMKYAVDLNDGLTSQQYSHLNILCDSIDVYLTSTEEYGRYESSRFISSLLFRKWLCDLFRSEYYERFCEAYDYMELLNKNTFELLCALNNSDSGYKSELYEIMDNDGATLFSYSSDKHICVYDKGEKVFDGWYDYDKELDNQIINGYKKTYYYDGFYSNGHRFGKGVAYNYEGRKLSEGIWKDDTLEKGIEYDWVIKINEETEKADTYFQFYKRYEDYNMEDEFSEMLSETRSFEGVLIADAKINGNYMEFFNERSFSDFLKTIPESEDHYSYLLE